MLIQFSEALSHVSWLKKMIRGPSLSLSSGTDDVKLNILTIMADKHVRTVYTVKPSFSFPRFNVYPHLRINFNDLNPLISVLNFLHLRFFSHCCSSSLLPKETLNRRFTIYTNIVLSLTSVHS
jgi:hypothetical protein